MGSDHTTDKLEYAREAIIAQIEERNLDYLDQAPRWPWDRVTKALSYAFHLPAEQLRSIRLHCDLFLGENTPNQFFIGQGVAPDYLWMGEGVDPNLWASEPVIPALGEPIGAVVEGKYVTQTTILLQCYLCNLLRLGLKDGQHVVEVGAGYGGLAEAVIRARRVRYTIIDLPETLIFSAAFLIHHFPDRSIYVYRPGDLPEKAEGADIILLPNYRMDWLQPCNVAINTVSFPEMDRSQLKAYVDVFADRLGPEGFVMSVNYHGDRGDGKGVPDFLEDRFDLHPTPSRIMEMTGTTDITYRDLNFRPTLIGSHKGAPPPSGEVRGLVNGPRLIYELP